MSYARNLSYLRDLIRDFILDLGPSESALPLWEFAADALRCVIEGFPFGTDVSISAGVETVDTLLHMEKGNKYPSDRDAIAFYSSLKTELSANPIDWSHVGDLYRNFL